MTMKNLKRIMVLLIAVAMIFSMIPSTSFAWADTENPTGTGDESSSVFDVSEGNETEEVTLTEPIQGEEPGEGAGATSLPARVETIPGGETDSDGDVSITARLIRGYTEIKNGNYVWVPGWDGDQTGSGSGHGFQYELLWSIDSEKAGDYAPGSISVKIPKRILYHFDFDSNGDPIMDGSQIKRVPDATICSLGLSTNPGDIFTYREEGDFIIIYNQAVPTEQNYSCTVTYRTEKPTFNYLDYDPSNLDYCGSDVVRVEYRAKAEGEEEVYLPVNAPRVFIDTSATLIDDYTGPRDTNAQTYNKDYEHPFASRKTMDAHWNDGNTNYMRFLIEVTFKTPVTQAYDLKVTDVATDLLASTTPCNLRLVGYRFETSKLGTTDPTSLGFTDVNEVHGLTAEKMYVYVLVAADAPSAGSNTASYKIKNSETTDVDSACGVDDHQTRTCNWGPWTWSFNVTVPDGKFMLYKWGNNNWQASAHNEAVFNNNTGEKSKYPIASYELDKFQEQMENGDAELNNISFFMQWYGFGWAWTRSKKTTDVSVFGKKDVQWTLVDDEVYLEGQRLSAGDYYVDSVDLHVASHNRVWSTSEGKWVMSGQTQLETYQDDKPFYLYAQINGEYVLAATAEWRGSSNLQVGNIECNEDIVTVTRGYWVYDPGYSVGGYIFKFKNKNVTGYKFVNENRHYQHYAYTRANFTLLSSEKVKNLVRGKQEVNFRNYADMIVKEYNLDTNAWISTPVFQSSTNTQANPNRTAYDIIVGEQRSLNANKTALSGENDTANKYYKTSWFMNSREHLDSGPRAPVYNDQNNMLYVQQQSGVFYDLLPRGTALIPESVEVYSLYADDYDILNLAMAYQSTTYNQIQYRLTSDQYTVEQVPNYKGERGYTLVKITINKESIASSKTLYYKETPTSTSKSFKSYPGYSVKFDTATSWETLDDYGSHLYNSVAYKTGNIDDIIQVGTTKDTTVGSALQNLPSSMEDKDTVLRLMKNLEYSPGTTDIPKIFTYAYGGHEAVYDTSSVSGLSKAVMGERDPVPVMETEVDPGGKYSYRLRYSAGATTQVTDVIMYDNLETYVDEPTGKIPLWRGTPTGIAFEVVDETNFHPIVYLSDQDVDFSQYNAANLPNLSDTAVWTKYEDPSSINENIMKDVKSIAIDFGSYVIKPYKSVNVWVDMKAPTSNETDVKKPPTYNVLRASANKTTVLSTDQPTPAPALRAAGTPDFTVSRETKVSYELKGEVKIQKVDDLGEPMEGVQFTLTGTSKFGDNVNLTGETDASGYLVFSDLDISGDNGYTLTETVPSGYIADSNTWTAIVNTDGSSTVDGDDSSTGYYLITNREETSVYADKTWLNGDGTTNPPEGATIEFTLVADGTETEYKVTLDGTAETTVPATAGGYESEAWKATFVHLPKYKNVEGVVTPVVYTVKETGYYIGYTPVEETVAAGGTITNKETNTELSVTKAWKNADGSTTAPQGGKVTFTLLADGAATNYTVELDGTPATAAPEGAGGYESEAWKASFVNLPKYKNNNGTQTEIVYTVVETGEWPGYTVSYPDATLDYAVNGETITNTQDKTNLAVTKAWKNADGTTTSPDGAEVTFTLYAGDNATNYTVTLDGTVDSAVVGTGGYESAAWKASFVNLPKYRNENGTEVEIQYTVVETGKWPGYTVSYEGGETATSAVDGGVITNTEVPTELSVTKAWKNADGSTTAPEDGEVTFTLYADGNATNYTVTLDGTADTAVTGAGGYESAAWTATFVNLPKYRIEEGKEVEIQYTVKEDSDGQWPGYTVSYSNATVDYAANGETITNTQQATGLSVTKAWVNADGTTAAPRGAQVTFTLYADDAATNYTVTLDGTADTAVTGTGGYESAPWTATFVNLPEEKIVNGTAQEINYTVVESGEWPGYTVSYEGGETATYAVDGGVITNTQDKTELSVIKAWVNADGSTTAPDGAEVTFTLHAGDNTTNYTVTLDGTADTAVTGTGGYESAAWTATFVNLPKYKIEEGKEVEIQYTVSESGEWPGYTVIYPNATAGIAVDGETITNTQEKTELSVIKVWQNADGTTTAPDGAEVTFTLFAGINATDYKVTLDGTADTAVTGTGGYESEAWKATFINLPKYKIDNGTKTEIQYTVVETGTWPGYTVIYEGENAVSAIAGGAITNAQLATGLSVTKAWVNADGTTAAPRGAQVTFTLYADDAATNYTVTLDGTADTAVTGTGGYESAPWTATFVNLPEEKIVEGTATEIQYTVVESGEWPGYTVSYEGGETATHAVDGGVITNTQDKTELAVTKAWKNADGTTTAPDGAEVTFTLYAGEDATNYTVSLDGTIDPAVVGTGGYESAAWKATFVNLPKYNGDDEIEYTVSETGTWPGYTVSYGDGTTATYAVDGGTITNTQVPTGLSVVKAWKNADGSTTPPEGGKVTFTLYADGTATNYTVELDGTADTAITGTGGYESAAWKATFVNLPKYNGDDEIEYTVQETGTWPGYTVSYGDGTTATYAVDGGTITNTQVPIELSVTKAWKNADGTTTAPEGGKVTFTLYADGTATNYTVELDGTADPAITGAGGYESAAWKATFINLPKYDGDDEIEYTVQESGTWPGYTVSYGDNNETFAVDGGTITNTQVPTELSVVKAWKNADGSTTAPEGGKVTFTLLADGTATNYTVELDGTPDTAITGTGGYESEAWKATFINLPKYKIENGKEAEIEYTVTETGTWPGYTVSYEGGETATSAVDGGVITNTQITTEIGGTKTWNDDDFFVDGVPVDGYQRPESITVNLLADGTVIDSKTVTEEDDWEYEFTDLPKYRIENGTAVEIVYTVEEETVGGYSTVIDGTDISNTPVKAERVTPTQIWLVKVDALTYTEPEPEDPIEPDEPEENVSPAMRSESGGDTFTGLEGAEFTLTDPNGNESKIYTNENGEARILFETEGTYKLQETAAPSGYQNPGTVYTIEVEKVFTNVALVDDENAPGGKVWMWYYQLEADVDADYNAETGILTVQDPPELTEISGEKIWDDENDADKIRPKSIVVELYADGEKVDEQTVTAASNWKFTFTDLPKVKDGEEIVYTIGEVKVEGYTTKIDGFKITNTHKVVKTGDEMNLGLWIGMLIMALAAMGILGVRRLIKKR